MVVSLFKACRPHQWSKNLLVAAPLIFSRRIDDPIALLHTIVAIGCFCLLSSAVYLLNDLVDIERDRAHPLKRHRPIAAGTLPVGVARVSAGLLALGALAVAGLLSAELAAVATAYLAQNIAYSFWLKRIPFVDVALLSTGFLLRVLAGAVAIPVAASGWLLACTLLLAAFMGFGKRAHELRVAGDNKAVQRKVLERYDPRVLRVLMLVLAVLTIAAYAAYTQSRHALAFFHTRRLAFTVPFAAFALWRFQWMTSTKVDAESPTDSMLRDVPFLLNVAAYVVVLGLVIYAA
jgi:decaprenyl-phosphate phosphoribosyltransferase